MSTARMHIRIISLGEVVTPNIMLAIQAFTSTICNKNQSLNQLTIGQSIGQVLKENITLLDNFKIGTVDETEFTTKMINALHKATMVELSIDEFNKAWNTMNPKFDQFKDLLKQAIEYNKQPNQQLIFISFTNPKDIRHLINELAQNKFDHKTNDDQLIEIGGVQLFTTYTAQLNKAKLIENHIKRLNNKQYNSSPFTNSLSTIVSTEKTTSLETPDIKYIRSINNINDPILKEELDKTNNEINKTTERLYVETIIWMKQNQQLSEILSDNKAPSKQIDVMKL